MLVPPPPPRAMPSASAPSIARFFSTSPESLWASITAAQPALVADAQRLFEQITASRQGPLCCTSLVHALDGSDSTEKKTQPQKIWAVVAVVATAIAHELRGADNGRGGAAGGRMKRVAGRKRKIRSGESDASSVEEAEEKAEDHNGEEEDNGDGEEEQGTSRSAATPATWHVVDFLVEANVTMAVFLENLTSLFDRLLLDPELLEVTTILKEEFTVATVLFEKYRVVWKKIALQATTNAATPERMELLVRVGWLLFLVIRRRLASTYAGLGNLYYLLLAVVKLMIGQVAPRSVEAEVAAALSSLGAPVKAIPETHCGLDERAIMDMLCSSPKVDPEEVNKALLHVTSFVDVLVREETLVVASGSETGDADVRMRGVFAKQALRQNATQLFEFYANKYLTSCGNFDERVYLNEQSRNSILGPRPSAHTPTALNEPNGDSHAVPPLPLSTSHASRPQPPTNPLTSPVRRPSTPSRHDTSGAAPPPSPFTVQAWQWHGSSPPPALPRGLNTPMARTLGGPAQSPFVMQTPVTAAVEISSWIRDTLAGSSSSTRALAYVSDRLRGFFKECTSDPTERIADILSETSQKLLMSRRRVRANGAPSAPLLDPLSRESNDFSEVDSSVKKTTDLAIALFFRVLEALLVSERDRLRTSNFSSLLNNETFISSLFACSLEVGLKAHSLITLSFPFLLETVDVNAFDFGKVIESFVKHVPRLPSSMKRHMRDLEQMILDSLAWRSDSRLYTVLKGEKQQSQPPSTDSATSSTTPTTTTAPRATVLQLFFRKVMALAATRIHRLGMALELDATHMNQVWSAVKECLSSQLHLLKDRHLDQIILCSIYGVCKVNKLNNVTFNRIIEQYRKLQTPQWGIHGNTGSSSNGSSAHSAYASASLTRKSNDIIRDIKLDDEHARGDVIKFYNRCFIPSMKVFLLQYQSQDKQVAAANVAVVNATGSRDGHVVTSSTSDSELVAEAAASAVEKAMQSFAPPRTPVRGRAPPRTNGMGSPPLFGSPSRPLPMFTTAEVESLPVSVHQSSPKRVLASNVYMSPLQNGRYQQQRSHMTPRSHALYAFGESPSRDLALINRAVNTSTTNGSVRTGMPLPVVSSSVGESDGPSRGSSTQSTPTNKRRRT